MTTAPHPDDRLYEAAERIWSECARGNVGAAVYLLREYTPDERDRIAELLELSDPDRGPRPPAPVTCRSCRRAFATFAAVERHACHPRGQALVEFALVAPLLLLVVAGGLILALAMLDRATLTWGAQEAARSAAVAGAEDAACDEARAAAGAVLSRLYSECDGSDGLRMRYEPAASPGTVTIALEGGRYPLPWGEPVQVTGSATAVLRSPEPAPTPAASEGGTP